MNALKIFASTVFNAVLSQRSARNRDADERLRPVKEIALQTLAEFSRCRSGDDYWDIYVNSFAPLKAATVRVLEDVANRPAFTVVLESYLAIPHEEFGILVGPWPVGYQTGKDQAVDLLKKLIVFAKR